MSEEATALEPFLSRRGRRARMPAGVRVWGARAARAGGLDATLGVVTVPARLLGAADGGETIAYVPRIREAFAAWSVAEVFPYAPVAGVRDFRERWRAWTVAKARADGLSAAPDALALPVATGGVTGALAAVALLVLDPGDPVLVPDPFWDGYETTFGSVAGAVPRPVRLLAGGRLDVDAWAVALEDTARERGRVVWVANFPHNPTGYVPTADEAEALVEAAVGVAERSGAPVVAICDDAYEGYVYVDRPQSSVFHRLAGRHPRLLPVKCDGVTKELLFWGARLGAVTAALPDGCDPAAWETRVGAMVRGTISSASTPVQTLVARVLADPGRLLDERAPVVRSLAARRERMVEALARGPAREAFRPEPFHGGLFAYLRFARGDAVAAAEALLERKIGVVPFPGALRVTYATLPEERIEEVVATAAEVVLAGR